MSAAKEESLPLPTGGILWSPWVDLTDSYSGTWTSNQKIDFLPRDLAYQIALSYAGESNSLLQVSPMNVDMSTFPPLLVEVGDCECLFDQVKRMVIKGRNEGVEINEIVSEGMVHVFPLLSSVSKKESPPNQAFERAKLFVNQRFGRVGCAGGKSGGVYGSLSTSDGEEKKEINEEEGERRRETGSDKV